MHKILILSLTLISLILLAETCLSDTFDSHHNLIETPQYDNHSIKTTTQNTEEKPILPSIQEQINTCPNGGTITLPPGEYNEIFTINKPLTLKGSGKDTTTLSVVSSRNSYAIQIKSPHVTLEDLTIINQGPGLYTTGEKIISPHTTIQRCVFQNTPVGIAIWSDSNRIDSCEFDSCDDEGIVLLGSSHASVSHNKIINCIFQNNCDGIELQYATHTTITQCTFRANTHAGIDAIREQNNHNEITECIFEDNEGFGIYLSYSRENKISDCQLSEDTLYLSHTKDITLENCQINTIRSLETEEVSMQNCVVEDSPSQQTTKTIQEEPPTLAVNEEIQESNDATFLETLRENFVRILSIWQKMYGLHHMPF